MSLIRIIYLLLSPIAYIVYGGKTYLFAFDLLYIFSNDKERKGLRYLKSQGQFESNDFKSDLFKRSKNIFGMRIPSKRKNYVKNVGTKSNNNYAMYSTYMDSILDVMLWYQEFGIDYSAIDIQDLQKIITAIYEKTYFTGNPVNYVAGVIKYWKVQTFNTNAVYCVIGGIGIALWQLWRLFKR